MTSSDAHPSSPSRPRSLHRRPGHPAPGHRRTKQNLIADTLLLLEHPPVLTLGRNAIAPTSSPATNSCTTWRRDPRDQSWRRRHISRPRPARRLSHLRSARRSPRQKRPVPRSGRLRSHARRGPHPHLWRLRRDDPAHLQTAPASGRLPAAASARRRSPPSAFTSPRA